MNIFEQLPSTDTYDVIIAGGGTAGFAAAVSAGRRGLKTLLLEEKAFLGGTSTGGQISQLMGFEQSETPESLRGITADVLSELMKEGGTSGIENIYLCGRKDLEIPVIPYISEALIRVIHRLVRSAGVTVLLHTRVIGTETADGKISSIIFHNEEGIQKVRGKIIIDASFHGSVAADAGCSWEIGDAQSLLQPGTLMYQMADVDHPAFRKVSQVQRTAIADRGIEDGKLYVNNLLARELPNRMTYCNMSRIKVNPLDTLSWSIAEMDAREQVKEISDYFIQHVPGFENASLSSTASFTGLRDSRRIVGKYTLTNEDVSEGQDFPDSVVKSSYPIDIHDANGVDSIIKKPKNGSFSIPYRAMVTDKIQNLILAGRCISCEYEAHASIRVMITCMRLGEAAGIAAAESLKRNIEPNALDGNILRQILL